MFSSCSFCKWFVDKSSKRSQPWRCNFNNKQFWGKSISERAEYSAVNSYKAVNLVVSLYFIYVQLRKISVTFIKNIPSITLILVSQRPKLLILFIHRISNSTNPQLFAHNTYNYCNGCVFNKETGVPLIFKYIKLRKFSTSNSSKDE